MLCTSVKLVLVKPVYFLDLDARYEGKLETYQFLHWDTNVNH